MLLNREIPVVVVHETCPEPEGVTQPLNTGFSSDSGFTRANKSGWTRNSRIRGTVEKGNTYEPLLGIIFSHWLLSIERSSEIMDMFMAAAIVLFILFVIHKWYGKHRGNEDGLYPNLEEFKENTLLKMFNATHINAIVDQFTSFADVSRAVRQAGLESSNLIFGIDFTKSNLEQGYRSFGSRCLHTIDIEVENPYQQVIRCIGATLEPFDDDGIIPAFGFGDVSTRDRSVFPFRAEGYCHGFQDVLAVYNQLTPNVRFSGPTSFAPLIYQAIDIIKQTRSYHILIIIADGQVTSERSTREAIVEASKWPLSIIMVGVGDGPWETMKEFDDALPARKFDNFQFVDFNRVLSFSAGNPDQTFALHALMEIPDQYKAIRKLGLLDF